MAPFFRSLPAGVYRRKASPSHRTNGRRLICSNRNIRRYIGYPPKTSSAPSPERTTDISYAVFCLKKKKDVMTGTGLGEDAAEVTGPGGDVNYDYLRRKQAGAR